MTLTHSLKIGLLSSGQHNILNDSDFFGINPKTNFEKESPSKYLYYLLGGRVLRRNIPRSKTSQKQYKHQYQAVIEFIECQKSLDEARWLVSRRFLDLSKESKFQALEQTLYFRSTNPHKSKSAEIEKTFLELADKWREDTEMLSSISKKIMHPAYQQIIGMGKKVLPYILRELEKEPDHWFWALTSITREDPVSEKDDFDGAVEAWLEWGRKKELI